MRPVKTYLEKDDVLDVLTLDERPAVVLDVVLDLAGKWVLLTDLRAISCRMGGRIWRWVPVSMFVCVIFSKSNW